MHGAPTPTELSTSASPLPRSMRLLERGWLSANNIVFLDDDHNASVVDTGYVLHAAQTVALVRHALDGRQLARIVNTHLHSDHCGGNAALQATYGGAAHCAVTVPAGELQAVNSWDEDALSFRSTGQQAAGFSAAAGMAAGDLLQLGGMSWRVHAAPGHDPHALMLFQPEVRLLISGDALWQHGFGVVFPEMVGEGGFAATRRTLDAIAALAPAAVIPGHGAAFTDVTAALERARSRLGVFEANPERHARHGLRVLLKFQLLQQPEGVACDDLRVWFGDAELVARTACHFWPTLTLDALFSETLDALLLAGAASRRDHLVCNAGPA
ncbi:MAG: MBL fold metallo-hydrolase [Burkholderiales bacterium]|jgi:glyoxylase-like metal-dependent hydrolase (beta-lactamase superfamily II)|nr:MBL fold metallo-hydrolase [Burkholderiales bacterium]